MASERLPVEGSVLVWARTSMGLTVDTAARKIGVSSEILHAWERGEMAPTVVQLRNAAGVYKWPLAVLLLSAPPTDVGFTPVRDFRRTPKDPELREWTPALHAEYRRALSQRNVLLEIDETAPESLNVASQRFSFPQGTNAEAAGEYLRKMLELDEVPSAIWGDPGKALNDCVDRAEEAGVLVLQTQRIAKDEMLGFSISEWPHPVVALNGSDGPRRRLFTLLHELCHLALNDGGLCDLHEEKKPKRSDDEIEHYCNAAAAAALMPADLLLGVAVVERASSSYAWTLDELRQLSRRFGASSEALLLRLIDLGKATWDLYRTRHDELEAAYQDADAREKERRRTSDGGPSFYVIKARNLGHGYVTSVLDAFRARAISSLDVADYLEVRYDQLPKLEAALR
jgi:Zn-dependent peptidase ImmA (M78 family)